MNRHFSQDTQETKGSHQKSFLKSQLPYEPAIPLLERSKKDVDIYPHKNLT